MQEVTRRHAAILEGWMEALNAEVAPFGIFTTIVNPGFFRTELLTDASAHYATPSIDDYAEQREAQLAWWQDQNGKQPGDPKKLAAAVVTITEEETSPARFVGGEDAVGLAEMKADTLRQQVEAYRTLSTSLGMDDA